jgi:hypothetical protein
LFSGLRSFQLHIDRAHAMADPIKITSGMKVLTAFAFQFCSTLFEAIQELKARAPRVVALQDELEALCDVLGHLRERVSATTNDKLSVLNLPLLRCGKTCEEFHRKLSERLLRSGGTPSSFRGWGRLTYMGESIDEFKQQLACYRLIIIITLTDADL